MLKVFLFITERLKQSILTWPRNYTRGLHVTSYKYFSFTFVGLMLANIFEDGNTIFRSKVPDFTPSISVFHEYCQRLKHILLLFQFEICSAFILQGIASSRLLPSIDCSNEFLNRSAKSLDHPESCYSEFVKDIFATTCGMHAAKFE